MSARPRRNRRVVVAIAVAVAATAVATATAAHVTNSGSISIGDTAPKPTPASPYPSPISVSGLLGSITKVRVKLNGLTHPSPDDIDAVVTSPGGGRAVLMSDAGGTFVVNNPANLTFDDAAANPIPDNASIASGGTFRPANYGKSVEDPFCSAEPDPDVYPSPAPPSMYATQLSTFDGSPPNGTWNLYLVDDCGTFGATGSLSGGWTVDVITGGTAFLNDSPIAISEDFSPAPVRATPYPSTISVSGLTGTLTKATVTLNALTHFVPHNIDALVRAPSGANVLFMSDVGGTNPVQNPISLVFDDAAASGLTGATLTTGTFRPTNQGSNGLSDPFCSNEPATETFPSPAPPPPYGTQLSDLNGASPNGTWSLYVTDDCTTGTGSVAGGWSLALTTSTPTAVGVASLTSVPGRGRVSVVWRTASEAKTLGFNVFRSAPGRAKAKLNRSLIRARGGVGGGSYRLVDRTARPGVSYTYHLQVVRTDGTRAWYGATSTAIRR